MSDEPASYDFVYVETDIPPGMTIREWRLQRSAERTARRMTQREARAWIPRTWTLATALGRLVRASGRALVWRTKVRNSSGGHGRIPT